MEMAMALSWPSGPCSSLSFSSSLGASASRSERSRHGRRLRADVCQNLRRIAIPGAWDSTRSQKSKSRGLAFRLSITAATKEAPQNVDLPSVLPKRKKKPKATSRKIKKSRRPASWVEPIPKAPANGMLVQSLIPVAHEVMRAKAIVEKGVNHLMESIPVKTCRYCTETHVGPIGHNLATCRGPSADRRHSRHVWIKGTVDDVIVPVEAYHLADRLDAPITHEQRFDVERILAIDELCIQAGVNVPEYPTKRYTEPVLPTTRKKREDAEWMGDGKFMGYTINRSRLSSIEPSNSSYGTGFVEEVNTVDSRLEEWADETLSTVVTDTDIDSGDVSYDSEASSSFKRSEDEEGEEEEEEDDDDDDNEADTSGSQDNGESRYDTINKSAIEVEAMPLLEIYDEDDLQSVAEKTLIAWDTMRGGAKKLMTKYRVVSCGYCPEVHVGPRGHRAKNCGAFKHQWRDGKHGWQDAPLDEFIHPQFVWHVRDVDGPPLESALKRFYGKAPAVVELCVQAGAAVPEKHKPLMRLDIAIPTLDELEHVV